MKTIYFKTEDALDTNTNIMNYYLDYINKLEIKYVNESYAEVKNERNIYSVDASENGDFFSHKIEFEFIATCVK